LRFANVQVLLAVELSDRYWAVNVLLPAVAVVTKAALRTFVSAVALLLIDRLSLAAMAEAPVTEKLMKHFVEAPVAVISASSHTRALVLGSVTVADGPAVVRAA
jgi:hypothetical protein